MSAKEGSDSRKRVYNNLNSENGYNSNTPYPKIRRGITVNTPQSPIQKQSANTTLLNNKTMRKSARYSPARENVEKEAAIYKTLDVYKSDYIFPYKGSSLNSPTTTASAFSNVYFNMEHMEGSTLADYMKTMEIRLAEAHTLITKTAEALRWLAEKWFTHGDIKLDNVYREKDGGIRIFDFGSSKSFLENADMAWDVERDMTSFVKWIIKPLIPGINKFEDVNKFIVGDIATQASLINFYSAVIEEYGEKTGGKAKTHQTRKTRNRKTRKHKTTRYSK